MLNFKREECKNSSLCHKTEIERESLFKQNLKPAEPAVSKSLSEEENDNSLYDVETHNTSQSSLNTFDQNYTPSKIYVNFEEIENFDLFLDFNIPNTRLIEDIKDVSTDSDSNQNTPNKNEIIAKNCNNLQNFYLSEGSNNHKFKKRPSKFTLSEFEKTYEKVKFVDINENKPGNYNKYVTKVFETMRGFNKINFSPQIEERAHYLGPNIQKYTLLIDLDETLVHSDFNNVYEGECDHLIHFSHENEEITIPLFVRPGIMDFLSFCQQYFEICIFTASRREYADCILNFLDPKNQIFKYRFYRDDCIPIKGKIFIKDLRIFKNRYPENIIMIDNSLYSFANQLSNGILITSYYNNKNDRELFNLKKYLKNIIEMDKDVRIINEKVFSFEQIRGQILSD